MFDSGEAPIGDGSFCFDCRPGIECFGRCCTDADMYLYPYDIIRMKKNQGVDSDEFLARYTVSAVRDNPFFPSVMMKMSDQTGKPCPFLMATGCSIYPDRPSSCRTYPLERGVARMEGPAGRTEFYFFKRAAHCLGHRQERQWCVTEWILDQDIEPYNRMNDLWVEMDSLFRANPWGNENGNRKLQMAFMACFNVDRFRQFVFESSFLTRFNVPRERIEKIETDDVEMMIFGFDWVRLFLTGRSSFS